MSTPGHGGAYAAARRVADNARALNYETFPAGGYPGLGSPADAYDTIGALTETVRRLSQAADQLARFLKTQQDRPGLYDDSGGDPGEVLTLARGGLGSAAASLEMAVAWLGRVQQATAGLAVRGGDDPGGV